MSLTLHSIQCPTLRTSPGFGITQPSCEVRTKLFVHPICHMPNWVVPYRLRGFGHLKCDVMMVSLVKYRLSVSTLHFVYCVVVFPVRGLKLYQYRVRGFGSKQQGCGLVCLQKLLVCPLQCVRLLNQCLGCFQC